MVNKAISKNLPKKNFFISLIASLFQIQEQPCKTNRSSFCNGWHHNNSFPALILIFNTLWNFNCKAAFFLLSSFNSYNWRVWFYPVCIFYPFVTRGLRNLEFVVKGRVKGLYRNLIGMWDFVVVINCEFSSFSLWGSTKLGQVDYLRGYDGIVAPSID